MSELDRQYQYFLDNQEQLVADNRGKILIIHDCSVKGVFDNNIEAFLFGRKNFEPGTFLLQKCKDGPAAYAAKVTSFRVTS